MITQRVAHVMAIIRDTLLILIMLLCLAFAGRLAFAVDKAVNEPKPAPTLHMLCDTEPNSPECLNSK